MSDYHQFLASKAIAFKPSGFEVDRDSLNPHLFPFQRDIVSLALRMGRFCVWAKYGLGKSICQLEWSKQVHQHTGQNTLILAPLMVALQFVDEGNKFDIPVKYCRKQSEVQPGITVTNYEMLEYFDISQFAGVALDEASAIRDETSQRFESIIEAFAQTPYKSDWSATPSPNDYMEIGSHAEFMGVMTRSEMLAMFFTHDGGDTSKWRLKKHAEHKFWEWVATWAIYVRKPSDVRPDYDDSLYQLPALHQKPVVIDTHIDAPEGELFFSEAKTLAELRYVAKSSLADRVVAAAAIANGSTEQFIVWCYTNDESKLLTKAIPDAIEVKGSDSRKHKQGALTIFKNYKENQCFQNHTQNTCESSRKGRVIITKPSIFGWGVNLQNCHNAIFVGLNHQWEAYIQAVHRLWRFGQESEVNNYIIYHHLEGAVVRNIDRKGKNDERMADAMVKAQRAIDYSRLQAVGRDETEYNPSIEMVLPDWLFTQKTQQEQAA